MLQPNWRHTMGRDGVGKSIKSAQRAEEAPDKVTDTESKNTFPTDR